jgi:hypothetical protein
MPFGLPLIIPALLSAIGPVTGLIESAGQPSASDMEKKQQAQMQQQAQADAAKQAQQEQLTKGQLLRKASPDAQAATGGSLTDAPFAQLTSSIAGVPGDINEALKLLNLNQSGSDTTGLSGGF